MLRIITYIMKDELCRNNRKKKEETPISDSPKNSECILPFFFFLWNHKPNREQRIYNCDSGQIKKQKKLNSCRKEQKD